jgi:LysM repeat protein
MAITYTVQTGDTLFLIARRYGTTVERLIEVNNIADPNSIFVGQTLIIPEETESVETDETARNQATRRIGGLRYVLFTNKSVYRRGEDVVITLVKTNVTGRNVTLRYRTAQRYDFVARRSQDQREIWRWSRGRSFAQVASNVTLSPGSSQTFRVTWNQRDNLGRQVAPGTITIDGYNVAEGLRDEAVSVNIRVRTAVEPTPTPRPTPTPTIAPTPCPGENILVNPDFENWPRPASPPSGWTGSNLYRSTHSRTGNYAAGLGAVSNENAVLSQRVDIEPGRIYELSWWARENIHPGGVGRFVLFVEIIYTNRAGDFVGRTEPRYSQQNIPDSAYQRYSLSTGRVPAGARIAEVRFTFEPSGNNNNTVKIDNVGLRCLF